MGRTVKSFRIAVGEEELRWERAGKKLTSVHQNNMRDVLRSARLYASAASMSVRTTVFEAFFMAMLFHSYREGTQGT
jgi:hypothetical protein